jgi:hypothetical protein
MRSLLASVGLAQSVQHFRHEVGYPLPCLKGHDAHVPSTPTVFLQERTERIVVILTEVVLEEMAFDKLVGELIDVLS